MCSRKFKYFLLFSLFCSTSFTKLIAQPAYVKMYDRIPMKVQLWGSQWYSQSYVKLKEMGADIVMADQLDQEDYDSLYKVGIKIIPLKTTDSVSNHIAKYSEGAYTIWEAEGKISQDGDAELERETSKTFTCNKNGKNGIATNIGAAGDTILWGPGYYQQRWYTIDSARINYTAKFHLLIDTLYYPSQNPPIENNEDVVCTLQVTTTELVYDTILYRWYKGDVLPIDTVIIVKVKDFNNFGVWDTLDLSYDLMDVPVPKYAGNENKSLKKDASSDPPNIIRYIEFKIIWSGLSYIQLFADKVVLQDERGTVLMFNPLLQNRVVLMSRNAYTNWSPNFETTVLGWHTKDEPDWIDHLEPIRFINHLIDSANAGNRQLFITIAGSWNGRFGDSDFGSESVSKLEEIVKRNKMQGNQVNYYLYDYPYNESDPEYLGGSTNIGNMLDWHLNKINKLDSVFVLSLQTGLWNAKEGLLEKIPTKEQFLYNLNVGLLYGAKEIDVSNYFYKFNEKDDTTNTTALYNNLYNYYTPLWFTIRDTVSPRLKGLFGKTLRNINQTIQYPKINASNSYNFISNFSGNLECLPATADYDLGFFKDSFNADYFMIVSRWYNFSGNCPIYANLDPNQFDYTNISLTKYMADTTFTVLSNGAIKINLAVGDAELIKVVPVVKYGGSLIVNETTLPNETLLGDMTIENGATLSVYHTYHAKANIIVKSGGRINNYENGKIIFDPGKKLIIEGTAEINGSSNNRLTLEFSTSTSEGIVVKPGGALYLSYADVKNAQTGINAEQGSRQINISNVNLTDCNQYGITLIGLQGDGYQTPPPPTVYKCNITGSLTGISASNYNEILINQNTISNSYLGITISSIQSAFIQGNIISGNSNGNNDGILVFNSGGYIRSNIVQNHVNGIRIGNSSPDIGGNILENNKSHGLYVGSGSIPNPVGHLQINPPLYFPLSGYNKIFNNGSGTLANLPGNDSQSEIYLSASYIALRDGCNEIRDDRTATPSMNTLLLMNGSLPTGGGRQLDVRNNYWGTTTPTAARFGSLSVIFSPYFGDTCPVPDGSGGSEELLVLKTSNGEVVDTIYAADGVPENFTTLQASYSNADNYFATGNVELAKPLYEQIVSSNYTTEEKLPAYNKLYTIGNLIAEDENYFNSLQSTFEDISNNEADTLIKKVYSQNAIKCDVSNEEYLTAISKFDNIIQQNPNSEEAVYAEIDILTTALNLDTTNTQLGKIAGGKYLVKGSSDYLSKLNNLLQNKFGLNSENTEQIIPEEYSLYQNYPNPFNPTTTIKFDIPKD